MKTEEERDFLLRSLDDLERERAAGAIDDATYERLHDDYTARAAAAVRSLRDGVDATPETPGTSARRRGLVIGGLVAFALVASIALAYGVGARLPGQTVTGGVPVQKPVSNQQREASLRAAVTKAPKNVDAHLNLARFYASESKFPDALHEFEAAATLAPNDPEPFAYSGWVLVIEGAPDQGLELVDKALTIDPNYADARFFRGTILLRDKNDPGDSIGEFQRYLVAQPQGPFADVVRQLLAEAVKANGGTAAHH
ncbi:MAG TPA: tetratricopeptide repeat protein [Acidimicrobiia bacterium]